jgi:predicted NBD/HSP70 family sugar kinase
MPDEASRHRRREAAAARKAAFVLQHPAGQAALRRHNLALILRLLRAGPLSRADLARYSGLNKATVSSLVSELAGRSLVRDTGIQFSSGGRPATLVELSGERVRAVGVQLDVDQVVGVIVDLGGRVVAERAWPLDAARLPQDEVLAALADATAKLAVADISARQQLVGVTVAVAGLVDAAAKMLRFAPNLGWYDVDVLAAVTARLPAGVPLHIDNEANLAAVAEYRLGGHAEGTHLLMVTGSVGVGGGLVLDGVLQRGAGGFGAEVGHMVVTRDGLPCGCGARGCLETLVGLPAILRAAVPDQAERLLGDGALSPADRLAPVLLRARAGDPATVAGLAAVGQWLGIGVASLLNVINPHVVVLGGVYRDLAPWLLAPAQAEVDRRGLQPARLDAELAVSALHHPPAALGAAVASLDAVFADPGMVTVPPVQGG